MSQWEYRVGHDHLDLFHLVEVYYNDDGELDAYGEPSIVGEDLEDLKATFRQLRLAFEKPVLELPKDLCCCDECEGEIE